MAAAAEVIGEQAKYEAYERNVARLPKRDRRELSRASAQTKWIMEAVTECWQYDQGGGASGMGLPTENVLYRAGLMIPRAPLRATNPNLEGIPERVRDVRLAASRLLPSRSRVLWARERHGERGIEYVAMKLRMGVNETSRYLKQARQSLADILRGMGYKVPQAEEADREL